MTAPPTDRLDAPEPPPRFRGVFRSDGPARAAVTGSSGPVRIAPLAVAAPRDPEDLAMLLAWAKAQGLPVFARGAGTGMPGGNVGAGICVDLTGWKAMSPVDEDARTVTAGPGVVAAVLERAAGERRLSLPSLPSSADRCTLGGMVANNAAGARSFAHGAVHRWIQALDVVLADGTPVTLQRSPRPPGAVARAHRAATAALGAQGLEGWPRVRKNASGYGLDRFLPDGDPVELFAGSEGTLGVVTSATFRLHPLPQDRALALFALPELEAHPQAVEGVRAAGASACEFFGRRFLDLAGLREHPELAAAVGGAPAVLLVELEGTRELVEEGLAHLRALSAGLGVPLVEARGAAERARLWQVRHAASPVIASRAQEGLVSMQFIEDSVVPPERLPEYLAALEVVLTGEETDAVMFGHAGDGNVHVNPLVDVRRADWRERVARILEAAVEIVVGLGGTLSGEHGDGRIRAPFHDRVFGPRIAAAFRAVKDELDPNGILNPGVVVALPGQDPLEGLSPEPRRAG